MRRCERELTTDELIEANGETIAANLEEMTSEITKDQSDAYALGARHADLGANFVKLGNNRYRVRVFNKGKCAARDVRIEFPEDSGIVPRGEITGKFPMEILEQHQSIDLIAAPDLGTKPKHVVTLRWTDDHASDNEKTAYLTL